MNATPLLRSSGLALLISGVGLVLFEFMLPQSDLLSITLSSLWIPVSIFGVIINIIATYGVIGLYLIQADRIGVLGLIASLIAFAAIAMSIASAAIGGFVFPAFARMDNAPATISALIGGKGPLAMVGQFDMIFVILFLVGFIALGILSIRAGLLGRWASALLLISTLMDIGQLVGALQIAFIGDILFGVAFAWLGYIIWQKSLAKSTAQSLVRSAATPAD